MKASRNWVWQPPTETIETIASVLRAHWAAAKSQQLSVFWPKTRHSWRTSAHHRTSGGRLIRYASGSASVLKPNLVPRS